MPDPRNILSYSELPGPTSLHHDFKFPTKDSKTKSKEKERGKLKGKDEEIVPETSLGIEKRGENCKRKCDQGSQIENTKKMTSNSASSKASGIKKDLVSVPTSSSTSRSRTNNLPSCDGQNEESFRNKSYNQVIGSKLSVLGSNSGELKKKLSEYSIRQINRSQRFLAKRLSSKSLHEDMIGMKINEGTAREEEFEDFLYPSVPISSIPARSLPPPLSPSGLETVSERPKMIETSLPVSSSSSGKKTRNESVISSSKSSSQPTRDLSEVELSTTTDNDTSHQSSVTALKDRNRKKKKEENLLVILKRFDTIFLIDDSVSMSKGDMWKETGEVLKALASKAIRYGSNGVDVFFLNSPKGLKKTRTWKEVEDLFQLEELKAPSTQIGIQFLQIGDNSEATEFLKILDDDLISVYGIKRDIVVELTGIKQALFVPARRCASICTMNDYMSAAVQAIDIHESVKSASKGWPLKDACDNASGGVEAI
ncbi:uncharacterized protein MELLADRAFT_108665 [Melampsora larici-populina 98AG31]|uniref:VWFA domain-containing protein n=1 Tax=Melampsora larici-populina (strain 98AG31 / pathotype 3-4-7) TaxID=747676 RepID=F4RTU6_MELLP|nr:uncharacterized protein MELLADRAFT_108665 [Melampsora larici-populina 98AG31]EGG04197.1 hypothetical protein MELLADRAFT_108665 [Melampsora larici-populina 98AG31]